jgi:hypothetical protein
MAAARRRGVLSGDQWRARADVAALATLLDGFSHDAPAGSSALRALMEPWLDNQAWIEAFFDTCGAAMRDDPFAAFPFQPVQSPAVHGLALLQTLCADVSLCWIDAAMLPQAQDPGVLFSATLCVVQVLRAGGLMVQAHRLDEAAPGQPRLSSRTPRAVQDGDIICVDNRRESLSMLSADADAVILRISCRLPDRSPQRSFDVVSGRMIATAMADDQVSRMLPLLSVARLAGRAQAAAPLLADLALHADPFLRWAAVREWLVADTAAAAATLPAMATDDPDAGVRAAAAATLAILLPQEPAPCLA